MGNVAHKGIILIFYNGINSQLNEYAVYSICTIYSFSSNFRQGQLCVDAHYYILKQQHDLFLQRMISQTDLGRIPFPIPESLLRSPFKHLLVNIISKWDLRLDYASSTLECVMVGDVMPPIDLPTSFQTLTLLSFDRRTYALLFVLIC